MVEAYFIAAKRKERRRAVCDINGFMVFSLFFFKSKYLSARKAKKPSQSNEANLFCEEEQRLF
jgi:hypothetical protein